MSGFVVIQDRQGDAVGAWVLMTEGTWYPLSAAIRNLPPLIGSIRVCANWEEAVLYSRKHGGHAAGNRVLSARSAGIVIAGY